MAKSLHVVDIQHTENSARGVDPGSNEPHQTLRLDKENERLVANLGEFVNVHQLVSTLAKDGPRTSM